MGQEGHNSDGNRFMMCPAIVTRETFYNSRFGNNHARRLFFVPLWLSVILQSTSGVHSYWLMTSTIMSRHASGIEQCTVRIYHLSDRSSAWPMISDVHVSAVTASEHGMKTAQRIDAIFHCGCCTHVGRHTTAITYVRLPSRQPVNTSSSLESSDPELRQA